MRQINTLPLKMKIIKNRTNRKVKKREEGQQTVFI